MTRMSKQSKRRAVSPRKSRGPSVKTGPKKDKLEHNYKVHENAAQGDNLVFIPKIA